MVDLNTWCIKTVCNTDSSITEKKFKFDDLLKKILKVRETHWSVSLIKRDYTTTRLNKNLFFLDFDTIGHNPIVKEKKYLQLHFFKQILDTELL